MIVEAVAAVAPSQYTAHYELLRSQFIAARREVPQPDTVGVPRGVGLALLLREGMPGWLNAVGAVFRASMARPAADATQRPAAELSTECNITSQLLSGVPCRDITTLLTSLILSTRRLERSAPREGYRSCQ